MAISTYVILNPKELDPATVKLAAGALFGDVVGLLVAVWKIVVNPSFFKPGSPCNTNGRIADPSQAKR